MNLDRALVVELVEAVSLQLHYLDAPDSGKFDPGPTMLQLADARVRKAHLAIICPEQEEKCPEVKEECPQLTSEHSPASSEHSASSSEHCGQSDLFGRQP